MVNKIDLALLGTAAVGGLVLVNRVTGYNPLSFIVDPITQWWSSLFPPTVPHLAFSKDSGFAGDIIGIAVDALKPSSPLTYGWKELNFQEQHTSNADGTWYYTIYIASSTPPGTYTVFVDQTAVGGPRYEKQFTVLSVTQ